MKIRPLYDRVVIKRVDEVTSVLLQGENDARTRAQENSEDAALLAARMRRSMRP